MLAVSENKTNTSCAQNNIAIAMDNNYAFNNILYSTCCTTFLHKIKYNITQIHSIPIILESVFKNYSKIFS